MKIVCPVCGMDYDDFRTGMTFADVKAEMYVASDNPEDWVYKRRGCVLRRWRKIKRAMFDYHVEECKQHGNDVPVVEIEAFCEY